MSKITFLDEDKISESTKVTTSTWENNLNDLDVVFTSSNQANFTSATSSGAFFIDVHNDATTSSIQYSVAYGNKNGSGSKAFNSAAPYYSPSSVTYNQYRNLVFGDDTTNFSFNGHVPNGIYVLNVNRARYKHNLKPGTLNLHLTGSEPGLPNGHTLHLTDDSLTVTGSAPTTTKAGRQYNIVSGSNGIMSGSNLTQVTNSGSYGLFYPDSGFIILNPSAIGDSTLGFNELTGSENQNSADNNHETLVKAISGGGSFIVDSEETVSSFYYFARVKNREFNYSTNPTFRDSSGNLKYTDMEQNPKVYITTVGLYNSNEDLLAVAKLSQPITKEFSKEALIRIKLDY